MNSMEYLNKILSEEESSIAQRDAATAKSIKPQLINVLNDIKKAYDLIENRLSEFNSPGLKASFNAAIREGMIGAVQTKGFNIQAAVKKLEAWYVNKE